MESKKISRQPCFRRSFSLAVGTFANRTGWKKRKKYVNASQSTIEPTSHSYDSLQIFLRSCEPEEYHCADLLAFLSFFLSFFLSYSSCVRKSLGKRNQPRYSTITVCRMVNVELCHFVSFSVSGTTTTTNAARALPQSSISTCSKRDHTDPRVNRQRRKTLGTRKLDFICLVNSNVYTTLRQARCNYISP